MKIKDLGYALVGVFVSLIDKDAKEQKRISFLEQQIRAKDKGKVLLDLELNARDRQRECNHRKGGMGAVWDESIKGWKLTDGYLKGRGDDTQYAVVKHTHSNGDCHVTCMRCGKKWRPGDPDHEMAVNFRSLNAPSSSIRFVSTKNGTWNKGAEVTDDFAKAWRKSTNSPIVEGVSHVIESEVRQGLKKIKDFEEAFVSLRQESSVS